MARPPKLRILVQTAGGFRELLAILERRDGELTLLMKSGEAFVDEDGKFIPLSSLKYSIHPSLQSEAQGVTLKYTAVLASGEIRDLAAFLPNAAARMAWPIFGRLCLNLAHDRYTPQVRAKDTVKVLASYDCADATPVYVVAVSRETPWMRSLNIGGLTAHHFSFRRFTISIFLGFLNLPPMERGELFHYSTSSWRVNGVHSHPDTVEPSLLTEPQFVLMVRYALDKLLSNFREKALGILAPDDVRLRTMITKQTKFLSNSPTTMPISY